MEIKQAYLTKSPYYTGPLKLDPKGLILHSVGVNQPSAEVFIKAWNSPSYTRASIHGFIDANTGIFYQTLPFTYRAPHCGGTANNTHIGVEMCEPAAIKYTTGSSFTVDPNRLAEARDAAVRTYNTAVELFAMLCKQYNLNPLGKNVILSHKEANAQGMASNHGDPEHLWKGLNLALTMDGFRSDVKNAMNKTQTTGDNLYRVRKTWKDEKSQIGAFSMLANAIQMANVNRDYCVFDQNGKQIWPSVSGPVSTEYQIKITNPNLNIRTGPGTEYKATGVTGPGVFTIVEEKDGWGLLKSYAADKNGWIKLSYGTKV